MAKSTTSKKINAEMAFLCGREAEEALEKIYAIAATGEQLQLRDDALTDEMDARTMYLFRIIRELAEDRRWFHDLGEYLGIKEENIKAA